MAATSPHSEWLPAQTARPVEGAAPARWNDRSDDPFNRYYRYPVARLLVRGLVKTPITPDQVNFVEPFLAAAAGYFVTFADARHLTLCALLFEARSLLHCTASTLASARQPTSAGARDADRTAGWLGPIFLLLGLFWHLHLHTPASGAWSQYFSVNGVILLVLLQGAMRLFSAEYYRSKLASIFEREPSSPLPRVLAFLCGISSGDAFLSVVTATLLLNRLWEGQLFFASVGCVWMVGVMLLNSWFVRSASRRWAIA